MSETISQLPTTSVRPSMTDVAPITIGYSGSGTGTTYAVSIADILSASGLIYAADTQFGGGVKANGSTDDTTAWTLVFQAAQNTGAWVVAPPGVSMVSAFSVPNGVAIIGRNVGSYSASVGYETTGTVIQGSSVSNATISLGQFCQLRGLQIIGTSAQPCVSATLGYVDIYDCTFANGSVGVSFAANGGLSRVVECRIHDCSVAGIQTPVRTTIGNCIINNCGSGIILSAGCNGVRITGGTRIEYCTNYGVTADGSGGTLRDLIISGCSFDAQGRANVLLRNVTAGTVTGNSWTRGGQNQASTPGSSDDCEIYLQSCNGVVVSGNTTRTGLNDSGAGYNSPYWAVYDGGNNANCLISSNILTYHNNNPTGPSGGPINSTSTFNLASSLNVSAWS